MRYLTWFLAILVVSGNALTAATFVGTQIPFGQYLQPVDTDVLAPTVPDQPVRLLVNFCAGNGVVSPPVATVWGMEIQVTQSVTDGGSTQACALHLIDLGKLPYGTYHVTTTRSFSKAGVAPTTYEFRFIVQDGTPAAPCDGIQSVTTAPDGGALVRYETQYYGYAPAFGVPSVRFDSCCSNFQSIVVTQPATDLAGMPRTLLCHAEEVNLGRLEDGAYSLAFGYLPSIPMPGPVVSPLTLHEFQWEAGAARCSNIPSYTTRGSLLSTDPFDLVRTQMDNSILVGPSSVDIRGSVITVDETTYVDDLPYYGLPLCTSHTLSVGPIPAGTYSVNWTTHVLPGGTNETGSFQVTISNPPSVIRRRAARH